MVGTSNKDDLYDVSDPSDWLNTPLASLAPIETSLRCQVCKDFYKTPMITSCSHTFCSLCIRRCLANDGKCPACRTTEQENKLRSNWAIEGLVDDFIRARPALLDHSRNYSHGSLSPKRRLNEVEPDDQWPDQPRKKTRSSSRILSTSNKRSNAIILNAEADGNDGYQPEDGLAPCPVCSTRMKVEAIDSHLNKCLIDSSNDPPPKSSSIPSLGSPQHGPTSLQKLSKLDRLPQLNYSLFKDAALRKKLQELGISGQGGRQLLERRHTEWVTIWNANCDASRPRKKIELLHELEIWERTQGARAPNQITSVNPASQILHKDFDGASWAAKHSLSFQNLIANARKNSGHADTSNQPIQTNDAAGDDEQTSEGVLDMPVVTPFTGTARGAFMNVQYLNTFQQTSANENKQRPAETSYQ